MSDKTLNDILLRGAVEGPLEQETSYEAQIASLRAFLSPLQLAFIDDEHRFKVARCGRRAGKSVMDVIYLIIRCLQDPMTPTLYLGLTRESAKNAVWDFIIFTCDKLGINIDVRVSELKITFDNGSFIRLFGADASNARERLRGQKYALIIIDEMGFYQAADYLIEALIPMLADYAGSLCMTSSPGLVLSGLFYEADQGSKKDGWRQHSWDLRSNPHFMKPSPNPRQVTFKDGFTLEVQTMGEEELVVIVNSMFGGQWSHPGFQREFLGQWVADGTTLVYPYEKYEKKANHNVVLGDFELPKPLYGIGIDLGSVSDNAIVVLQYSHYRREAVFVEAWKAADMRVDALGAKIQSLINQYDPTFIVADTGGYGKGIVDELKYRFSLPIQAADKTDKSFYQRLFADDLLSGYVKVRQDGGLLLLSEWDSIVKDENGNEVSGQPNHAADAALYIYRKVYQIHLSTFEPPKSAEERLLDDILEQARRDKVRESDEFI